MDRPLSAAARQYRLSLDGQNGVQLTRTGPADLGRLGVGRPAGDLARLSQMLFPLCPVVHTATALDAVEQAVGLSLPPGQRAARTILTHVEALTSGIMRLALGWPKLVDQTPDPTPVLTARALAARFPVGLFAGDWWKPGGAPLARDVAQIKALVDQLTALLPGLQGRLGAVVDEAAAVPIKHNGRWPGMLNGELANAAIEPAGSCLEETPRSLLTSDQKPSNLAPWFNATLAHLNGIAADLLRLVDTLEDDPPLSGPIAGDGTGLAVSMTARGRLRHIVSLRAGIVTGWRIAAPTDWNFAEDGPVARLVSGLRTGPDQAKAAQWLVAALDPCSPCEVQAHA